MRRRRVVVLGAGAAGLPAANRLARHAENGADIEVVLVDRDATHVFVPGYVPVMLEDVSPEVFRRPLAELAHPKVRLVTGTATRLLPDSSAVAGTFGDLGYDELVLALGPDIGWPDGPPPAGELAPWTPAGAVAGRETMRRLSPRDRVVLAPAGPAYRCPPALFDLAVRVRRQTGAQVDVLHPWPRPLAPFGDHAASAFTDLLAGAGVGFHGAFTLAEVGATMLRSTAGVEVAFDTALLVPPHRPPALVVDSPLAGPRGWPAVSYPQLTHPAYPNVAIIGDLASHALGAGMAGTLAAFEATFTADRIAATAGGPPAPAGPVLSALCFADAGDTGSFLHCDFTGPATGTGTANCALMPWLPYFREAKRLFAREWFTTMVSGDIPVVAGTARSAYRG